MSGRMSKTERNVMYGRIGEIQTELDMINRWMIELQKSVDDIPIDSEEYTRMSAWANDVEERLTKLESTGTKEE